MWYAAVEWVELAQRMVQSGIVLSFITDFLFYVYSKNIIICNVSLDYEFLLM
jgi:hypothetical protein